MAVVAAPGHQHQRSSCRPLARHHYGERLAYVPDFAPWPFTPLPHSCWVALPLIADQPAGRPPERKRRDRQEPDWAMWLDARRAWTTEEGAEKGM